MKRILAIVLSLCMLALMIVPAFAAEPDFITYPTIYIKGKVGTLGNNVGTPDQIQKNEKVIDAYLGVVDDADN